MKSYLAFIVILALLSFGIKAEAHSHASVSSKIETNNTKKNISNDHQSKKESKISSQSDCDHLFMFPSCSYYIRPLVFEQPEADTLQANYYFAIAYSPFRPPLA